MNQHPVSLVITIKTGVFMTSTTIYIEHIHQSCVYLITYSGNKLPPKFKNSSITPNKYIGSGFVEKIFDGYRGSVGSKKYKKLWKEELIENPHLFHLEFISFHNDRKEALDEEELVQREQNVVKSEEYVNMVIAKGNFVNLGHSEETKEKQRISAKNRPPQTEETRKRKSIATKGVLKSEEHKKKMCKSWENRPPMTEETKEKISKKNINPTEETREKMRVSHTGKTLSAETIAKRTETRKKNREISKSSL